MIFRKNGRKLSNFFDEDDYAETLEHKTPLKLKYKNSENGVFMKLLNQVQAS